MSDAIASIDPVTGLLIFTTYLACVTVIWVWVYCVDKQNDQYDRDVYVQEIGSRVRGTYAPRRKDPTTEHLIGLRTEFVAVGWTNNGVRDMWMMTTGKQYDSEIVRLSDLEDVEPVFGS